MTEKNWIALCAAADKLNRNREELLLIVAQAVSFVNRAAQPLGGNTLDQCRALNRRLRMAKHILTPATRKAKAKARA